MITSQSPQALTSSAGGGTPDAPAGGRSPWTLIIALGIGVFVGGFDQTFVVPVLGRILSDLDITIASFGNASWIINGYLLGYTVAMPLMGRIADVYGHMRVFVAGLLIFMAGSVLVALSTNLATLTIARAVTALGGGALVPVALAIAAGRLDERRRPLGLSTISMLDDASNLAGPLWGTLIGVWLGWRGLFWMNIALGLPTLLAVLWLARSFKPLPTARARVDWWGGALLTLGLTALTLALSDDRAAPRPLPVTLVLYTSSAALLGGFGWWERRVAMPLIDLRIFRSRTLVAANLLFLLEGGALIVALVNVPLVAETLWGLEGAGPGLMLARMVIFMIAGGVAGGLLAPVVGYRLTALAGFAFAAAGLFLMRGWSADPSEASRWLALGLAGFGFTLADAPIYATVVNAVEPVRRASVAAVLQVMQTTGMIAGMSLLGSEGYGRFKDRGDKLIEEFGFERAPELIRQAQHETFGTIFLVAALVMAAGTLLTLFLGRHGRHAATGGD